MNYEIENALKNCYLSTVSDLINNCSPLLKQIKISNDKVWGRAIMDAIGRHLADMVSICLPLEITKPMTKIVGYGHICLKLSCIMPDFVHKGEKEMANILINGNEDGFNGIENIISKNSHFELSDISDIEKILDDYFYSNGKECNFIVCGFSVRQKIMDYIKVKYKNLDFINLKDGHKGVAFHGIPVVADLFCEADTIYFLDTTKIELQQLCDWRWLEGDDGKILRERNNEALQATLVKYGNLIAVGDCGCKCMIKENKK